MKWMMRYLMAFIFMLTWTAGAVLAKGFWSTLFAVFFFPWGWYLVVERLMLAAGLL
jgi:hypothetical protein